MMETIVCCVVASFNEVRVAVLGGGDDSAAVNNSQCTVRWITMM